MEAGKLDRRITLRRASSNKSTFGTPVLNWANVATVWANKHDISDAERIRAEQTGASVTSRFQVRQSALISDINPTWQLVYEGQMFAIVAVKEIGRRVGWEITARALADL